MYISFLDVFVCSLSMKQLHDRVNRLREEYNEIYIIGRVEGKPSFNWGSMIDEKLVWKSEAFLAPVRLYRFIVKQSRVISCLDHKQS